MKAKYLIISLLLTTCLQAGAQSFIHPGLLHSEQNLNRIARQLEDGSNPSVKAGWQRFTQNILLTKNKDGWSDEIKGDQLIRGGSGQNFAHCERDFGMCYVKALYWRLKRESKNASERRLAQQRAEEAVYLLNKYARKIRGISGDTNYALLTGFQGWQVAGAAELLRDFDGWNVTDQQRFRQWLYDVWFTSAIYFLRTQHGQCDSHYMSNWPAANISTMQAIGIYLDDPYIYNFAMMHIKRGTTNAALNTDLCGRAPEGIEFKGFLPYFWDVEAYNAERGTHYRAPLGFLNQNQENTRDQGHSQVALGAQLQTCEQAWTQGDDLYGIGHQMLAGGVEYTAGWVSAGEKDSVFMKGYPNAPWWTDCGKSETYQAAISYDSRTNRTPVYQMAINHYGRRMGLDMAYSRQAKALCGVEGGTGFQPYYYSDVIGFGDLLFNEDSLTLHPTRLGGEITMVSGRSLATTLTETTRTIVDGLTDGQHQAFPELSNIVDGSIVRLEPTILDGSDDTGHWQWDDDTSVKTRTREVTVDRSLVLRVRYTNAQGVESVQMFSLHREGDGFRPKFEP
ncbi:MAG: alginate lyase family protein, partial [Bacteroidaceae bacterium]|nr:alginate lyase family protein [Bacteroidaceae bacterium]